MDAASRRFVAELTGAGSPRSFRRSAPACSRGRLSNAPDDHGACPHMNSAQIERPIVSASVLNVLVMPSSGVVVRVVKVDCSVSLRASKLNNEL